jgi:hypothetical protein
MRKRQDTSNRQVVFAVDPGEIPDITTRPIIGPNVDRTFRPDGFTIHFNDGRVQSVNIYGPRVIDVNGRLHKTWREGLEYRPDTRTADEFIGLLPERVRHAMLLILIDHHPDPDHTTAPPGRP